jgi:hypothetical protein
VEGSRPGASEGRYPGGKVSKAFLSSKLATTVLFAVLATQFPLMGLPSALFFGLPRSMIDASDSPRRWPIVGACRWVVSDCPLLWPIALGFGDGPALHGFGDDRPSGAELGVLETEVGAVETRELVEADIGVKGDDLEDGEPSIIRADFGGTSGGVEPDLSLVVEFCRISFSGEGAEVAGMTRGARIFGDKGCLGDPCLGVVF